MSEQERLYILDGSYYVFRAFFAMGRMTNTAGMPTNMLLNIVRDERPEHLVVCFDPPGGSFREQIYPDYKAHRDAPPEDLVPQFPWFRRIVQALNIPCLEVPGFEADDVIATLVKKGERTGLRATVLTGDKDLFQIVDHDTELFDSMRGKRVDVAAVLERFQVDPARVPDVLGLAGDSSDNIPGVPGIGEKTAGQLIAQFGDLETLLASVDQVSGTKRRENLATYAEQARLSKQLATVREDVPVAFDRDHTRLSAPDFHAFDSLCAELGFNRFPQMVRELFAEASRETSLSSAGDFDYRTINDESALDAALAAIRAAGRLSFDLETTGTDPLEAEIVGFALAWTPGQGVYVPVAHAGLFQQVPQLPRELVLERLRPLLEDAALPKLGQNVRYELLVMRRYGIEIAGFAMDTMLAAYVLEPTRRRYNLDVLALEYLGHRNIAYSDVAGSGAQQKRFDEVPIDEATRYAAEDADVTLRLADLLAERLEGTPMRAVHDEIELPLARVLADMEQTGIRVEPAMLDELRREFTARLLAIEDRIYAAAGRRFTIHSTQQLGAILFDELGLPAKKKTKTGVSTDQSVLEGLRDLHPLPGLILDYRQLAKLLSTYIEALPRMIRPSTGRVHTSFHQTVAATGRLSSADPNLQNIPVRSDEGRRIREAFVPEPGWVLLGGDYSQIELRILAHLSEDPVLTAAFVDGADIHRRTAAEIFDLDERDVTSKQRAAAKTINFGLIYGMGAHRLASELGISRAEATEYIERYFSRIAGVQPYFDRLIAGARENGWVETMFGRRRPIPELSSGRGGDAALGERLAVNTPIQGTAADLIKLAMLRVDRDLRAAGLRTRMLLQVHDELVFECPPDEVERARDLVRTAMEQVVSLRVPLLVELSAGPSWAALK